MGLSGLFRSLCFPLWISVESCALEIVGLESGLGLIIADFLPSPDLPEAPSGREGRSLRPAVFS
jgi:hypothetical protein